MGVWLCFTFVVDWIRVQTERSHKDIEDEFRETTENVRFHLLIVRSNEFVIQLRFDQNQNLKHMHPNPLEKPPKFCPETIKIT